MRRLNTRTRNCRTWLICAGLSGVLAHTATAQVANNSSAGESDGADSTRLDEIVVESRGEPTPDKPLGIGIRGSTLQSAPGASGDPLRGLQSLPGLIFTDDESAAPAVRGSRPGDNIFEVDFLQADYLFHVGGALSVFNADLIDSFDIYAAAYGPEYSGVTGGVFDVHLRDPQTSELRTTLDINFLHAGVLVEGPIGDKQSFYLAGRRSYLDLLVDEQLDDEEDDGVTITEFPNYSDYQGKYVWKPTDTSTLRVQITGAEDSLELNIAEDSEEIDNDPIFAGRIKEHTTYHAQSLLWDQALAGDRSLKTALSHTYATDEAAAGGAGSIDVDTDQWQIKSHLKLPLNSRHELTIGADYTDITADIALSVNDPGCTEFEPDCRLTGAERLNLNDTVQVGLSHAFIKDSWFVSDKLTLIPGLSIQHDDYLDKSHVEPRVSAEYALRDDLILSAGAGLYHQLPNFDQINAELGNPELDYIESVHAVVGMEKLWGQGWSVKSELYYKTLDNLVAGDEQLRYNNNGHGRTYGFDTLIRKELTDKWSGWLALSLSDSRRENEQTGDEFAFDYDQPVNASLVASYKASDKWRFSSKLWVHSGAPFTPITGAVEDTANPGFFIPQYAALNSDRLPDYQRLDIRADRTFVSNSKRQIGAYVEVLNLLDTRNVVEYDYNRDYTERTASAQLPRILTFGVKASF